MKTLFISPRAAVKIGDSVDDLKEVPFDHLQTYDQLLIEEPTNVVAQIGEQRYNLEANADDVIFMFYAKNEQRVVVVSSPELANIIREKRELERQEKARWAAKDKSVLTESTDK